MKMMERKTYMAFGETGRHHQRFRSCTTILFSSV